MKIRGLGRACGLHSASPPVPDGASHRHVRLAGEKDLDLPGHNKQGPGHLERLGIVQELTAQKRNRLFSYAEYVGIMNRGTELPGR